MPREELLKKVEALLADGPFTSQEIDYWQERLPLCSEQDLSDLFDLLSTKQELIDKTNEIFSDAADDLLIKSAESPKVIPKDFDLVDWSLKNVTDFFKQGLAKIIQDEKVNLEAQIDQYFVDDAADGISVAEEAQAILAALRANQEPFPAGTSVVIGKWLSLYAQSVSSDKLERASIDRLNFVNQNESARQLKEPERAVILRLLKLFDFLEEVATLRFVFEETPAAAEAEAVRPAGAVGQPVVAAPVRPVAPVKPAAKPIPQEEILKLYRGSEAENSAIEQKVAELNQKLDSNLVLARQEFYQALMAAQPDRLTVLAYLYFLAQRGQLDGVLKEDDRFYKLMEGELVRLGQRGLLNDFKMAPAAPQFIQLFLELVLQGKLGLAENEAARQALRLVNVLKQAGLPAQAGHDKYGKIAYFDLTTNEFKWKK